MEKIITLSVLLYAIKASSQDYRLKINDTAFDVNLDRNYGIMLNGKKVNIIISAYDTLKYDDSLVSFSYSKDFKISTTKIEEGIEQLTIINAEGNGILVQKYTTMNPTQLNEILMTEMTKKDVQYGYVMKRTDYKRTLKSGQTITVNKAALTYKDDSDTYEIASVGKQDEGILIITIATNTANNKDNTQGKKIIDLLWNSLMYK